MKGLILLILIFCTFSILAFAQKTAKTFKDFQCPPETFNNGIGFPRDNGNGRGIAVDSADNRSEVTTVAVQSVTNSLNSPLKIFSKPKAFYTDAARKSCVEGDVWLRIEFLKNGKIGKINIINSLPLGLSESAVKVAKKIKFEPERKNGKPISVTKQIKYNFTLY